MKNLLEFLNFDWVRFAEGKVFRYVESKPWKDGNHIKGTVVVAVIAEDTTKYQKPGSNVFEKISFKVAGPFDQDIPFGAQIVPTGDVVARIWGEYRNNLSVTCSGVEVVLRE